MTKISTTFRTIGNIVTESLAHPNSTSHISRETGKVVQRIEAQPVQVKPKSLKALAMTICNIFKESFIHPKTTSHISRETGKVIDKLI